MSKQRKDTEIKILKVHNGEIVLSRKWGIKVAVWRFMSKYGILHGTT